MVKAPGAKSWLGRPSVGSNPTPAISFLFPVRVTSGASLGARKKFKTMRRSNAQGRLSLEIRSFDFRIPYLNLGVWTKKFAGCISQ